MEQPSNPSGSPPNNGKHPMDQEKVYVHSNPCTEDMAYEYCVDKEKLDNALLRLRDVEAKMDFKMKSKPGYKESFVLGVASGAAVKGIMTLFPPFIKGIGQIWQAVGDSFKS